jgi:arylsulfatase A-like enzyme
VADACSLVDVLPTILDLAGVAAGTRSSGRSLVPLLEGKPLPATPHYAEIEAGPVGARAVFHEGYALVRTWKVGREHHALYHLARDPAQGTNELDPFCGRTAGEPLGRLAPLLESAFAFMEEGALPRESRVFDEETRRALEAIGYTGK